MSADSRFALLAGALLAATGVALGAFGAHGLRSLLSPEALGWWQTAVQYQMWQAIGLVAVGAAPIGTRWPARMLAAGTLLFSGSLYAMALSGARWLGDGDAARRRADDRRLGLPCLGARQNPILSSPS